VDKVVNSGHLIMLIIIYTFLCIVGLEPELLNHFKDFGFRGDRVLPDYQALILANGLKLLEPSVFAYILGGEASVWVSVQNF
jgi:hypothetical protein